MKKTNCLKCGNIIYGIDKENYTCDRCVEEKINRLEVYDLLRQAHSNMKIIGGNMYNEQNAETDINKENEYELPLFLNPEITRAETYNKKTKKWRDVDYYICLKIVKPLKTDKKLKIHYE